MATEATDINMALHLQEINTAKHTYLEPFMVSLKGPFTQNITLFLFPWLLCAYLHIATVTWLAVSDIISKCCVVCCAVRAETEKKAKAIGFLILSVRTFCSVGVASSTAGSGKNCWTDEMFPKPQEIWFLISLRKNFTRTERWWDVEICHMVCHC